MERGKRPYMSVADNMHVQNIVLGSARCVVMARSKRELVQERRYPTEGVIKKR